jgi:hypothetical protein
MGVPLLSQSADTSNMQFSLHYMLHRKQTGFPFYVTFVEGAPIWSFEDALCNTGQPAPVYVVPECLICDAMLGQPLGIDQVAIWNCVEYAL